MGLFQSLAVGGFVERLSNIIVCAFDLAICVRVVAADSDVGDMIVFGEIFESENEWCAVVSYNFGERALAAEEIIVYPITDGFASLFTEATPFRVMNE